MSYELRARSLPLLYREATIENIEDERVKSFALTWCAKPQGNVVLSGKSGVGKTWAAAAMMRESCTDSVRFEVVADLAVNWREALKLGEGDANLLYKLGDQGVLVLDDLGTRTPTEGFLDFLYVLVNKRLNNNLPTICTTNMTSDEMRAKCGDALMSRLCSGNKPMRMEGKDRRISF